MNESLRTLESVLEETSGNNLKFYIPSYQRGYRWTSSETRQLLEDVDDEQPGHHYFLQLLAVREDDETKFVRIVDGQQRLTTALLILDCMDGGSRIRDMLEYETRKGSALDKHFMGKAAAAIHDWLGNKSDAQKEDFTRKLKACEFLYFPLQDEKKEFDFFSRLNTWKISATDAELVKCFFLSNDDCGAIEKRAIKWNQMERQLSDNRFWGMFANQKNAKCDRMGILLSLVFATKQSDGSETMERFPLFEACKTAEKSGITRAELWKKVEEAFGRLLKWHGDRSFRHLVGWFFHCSETTLSGAKAAVKVDAGTIANAMKTANYLCGDERWLEDPDLFDNAKPFLQDYLLLANAAWCSERCGVDYDFYRHALIDGWSIEHVHARNQRMLGESEFKSLKFKDGKNLAVLWEEYKKKETKDEANAFLQDNLSEECGYPEEDEDNSLGNLALLPKSANSSLNDKLFKGKQREILSWALRNDESGYWAPPLTVSMFVKEIGDADSKFSGYWSKRDREAYAGRIKALIREFLDSFDIDGKE